MVLRIKNKGGGDSAHPVAIVVLIPPMNYRYNKGPCSLGAPYLQKCGFGGHKLGYATRQFAGQLWYFPWKYSEGCQKLAPKNITLNPFANG